MNNVLLLGGTGFIGRHVCEKLHRQGWRITVPTRRARNAASVQHLPRVTVIEANVHDPAQLLGLRRTTLVEKLRKYGIEREDVALATEN